MYPLLIKPVVKDYLWGGSKIVEEFNIQSNVSPTAEAWILSSRQENDCIILNGELKGKGLNEILKNHPEFAGDNLKKFNDFPVLVKLIDAKDNLSLQVHPSDEYAKKHENSFGKTEIWYIIDCENEAELIFGFKEKISSSEFATLIRDNKALEVCNKIKVQKGDLFFIPSGTLHAIGKGILIAEVQQNSDLTFRVYDYARVGADGLKRELHIDKALQVLNFEVANNPYSSFPIKCEYFNCDLINLKDSLKINNEKSFEFIFVVQGKGILTFKNETLELSKGNCVLIPASVKAQIFGQLQILNVNV